MACNCIKEFNYLISYDTCKRIVYQDTSSWVEEPLEYQIDVITPINNTPITLTVPTTGVLVIDSVALGLSADYGNLPSGIYCITVTNCNGDKLSLDFLNLCTYKCQLASLLAVLDLNSTNYDLDEQLKEYSEILFLIQGAEAKFNCDWCSKEDVKNLITRIKSRLSSKKCNC